MTENERDRVFISYSHKDRRLFEEFRTMIVPALRSGLLDVWHDKMISPGTKWKDEIASALKSTKVAVLLVSKHFLASEFISNYELPPLLTAARKHGVTVFWILLSDCMYQATEIVSYQAAHDPAKPLDLLRTPQRNTALREICAKLVDVTLQAPVNERALPVSQAESSEPTPDIAKSIKGRRQRPAPEADSDVTFRPAPHVASVERRSDRTGELFELFERGYQAILISGLTCSGKSELVSGFTRVNTIVRGQTVLGPTTMTGATNPGEVWYQVVAGQRRRVLIDPSGELFHRISPYMRAQYHLPDLTPSDFAFMSRAVERLAGIVLVFDLTRARPIDAAAAWRDQENDFHFILAALRWLRFARQESDPEVGLTATIAARAWRLPRIDVPILVAFTKADRLEALADEVPVEFARRRLPVLHAALRTHASRYRYDFCHTMIHTDDGDQPVDRPVGVLLPFEWLLQPPWSWMPRIPTRALERRS